MNVAKSARPPGLLKAVRERLESEVFAAPRKEAAQFGSVLACDEYSLSLLESLYKVNDLTRHGVPIVEDIERTCGVVGGRQSLSRNPIIYLCRCTRKNIESILEDWRHPAEHASQRDWRDRPYLEAHVFFISSASKSLTSLLTSGRLLLPHLKNLRELSLDFLPVEPNLYLTNTKSDLRRFFGRGLTPQDLDDSAQDVANRIVDVVATMGDTVCVRHHKGHSAVAHTVAKKVVDQQHARLGVRQGETTLLVLDRSVDPAAPLLHELSYQAMLHDTLPSDPNLTTRPDSVPSRLRVSTTVATPKGPTSQTHVVGETDELWCRMRHAHIADNGSVINKEFQQLVSSSKALNLRRDSGAAGPSTEDMQEAVHDMPLVRAKLANYRLHMDLHEALMKMVRTRGLDRICDMEQNLATRETADGAKVDKDSVKREFDALLETSGPEAYTNKLRLLLLYVISLGGLSKERQQKWVAALGAPGRAELSGDGVGTASPELLIANLSQFDVQTEKKKWYQSRSKKKKRKAEVGQDSYDWSRYIPCIKTIVDNLVAGDLNEMECPHTVKEEAVSNGGASSSVTPAGRGSKRSNAGGYQNRWGASLRQGAGASMGAGTAEKAYPEALPWSLARCKRRIYVFVVGGVTYSETRAIAELIHQHDCELILGTTALLTPATFLRKLAEL